MENLSKLRPDRDLQCYFERPSAVAAMSGASPNGFHVSGSWRQQFDWVVIEWNRDNVFEHPAIRNLPNGNLSGLHLSYEDERTNCIPLDSTLFATVDWPYLRIWTGSPETLHQVRLKDYATPVAGAYSSATAEFEMQGALASGDHIELSWLDQHFNYQVAEGETTESAVESLAEIITAFQESSRVSASASGTRIVLRYAAEAGSNANRVGVYGIVKGAGSGNWSPSSGTFSGGISPSRWRINLDFSNLHDKDGAPVPTVEVRKVRWTWAADLQSTNFARSEFDVAVTDWVVDGTDLQYQVAGPGSRRIEDDSPDLQYLGAWTEARGNYSGGSIRWSTQPGTSIGCSYTANAQHILLVGTRRAEAGGSALVRVDDGAPVVLDLYLSGEDVLVRVPMGQYGPGSHTVTLTHTGVPGTNFYFDYLEIALPTPDLPEFVSMPGLTLATDWDTDHSLALPPERTAWIIQKLGFHGRGNHYVGALWFYELARQGHTYASSILTFNGTPAFGTTTLISLNRTPFKHLILNGDTAETVAKCFELLIRAGSTGVWANTVGAELTITSRTMGEAGNGFTIEATTGSTDFTVAVSGPLSGGTDGQWRTDLTASPRINRAARDWSEAYFRALKSYEIDVAAAFSMELQHGDDSPAAGIAQRYSNGDPVLLNTPALQTNFGPESTIFWQEVYRDMARLMSASGMQPYLQFGEVQWWYFGNGVSMPFYDSHTQSLFQTQYGRPMPVVSSEKSDPATFRDECTFVAGLIGQFTDTITAFVRTSYPSTRIEVLYPPDVNDTPLNQVINFPRGSWTPATLDCLKTENFTYTGNRDLDKARSSVNLPLDLGFPQAKSSHLVGIGEYTTPWEKEQQIAEGQQLDSVVLFAVDQFCLIGYKLPLARITRRSRFQGG